MHSEWLNNKIQNSKSPLRPDVEHFNMMRRNSRFAIKIGDVFPLKEEIEQRDSCPATSHEPKHCCRYALKEKRYEHTLVYLSQKTINGSKLVHGHVVVKPIVK